MKTIFYFLKGVFIFFTFPICLLGLYLIAGVIELYRLGKGKSMVRKITDYYKKGI